MPETDLSVLFSLQGRSFTAQDRRGIEMRAEAIRERLQRPPVEQKEPPRVQGKTDLDCLREIQYGPLVKPFVFGLEVAVTIALVAAFAAGLIFLLK